MKFKSQIVTQASGSIGGTTFSRSRGGVLYQRARAIPTNTPSTFRTQVRNSFASLVNAWTLGLSPSQRQGWDLYAANVAVINSLGDSVHNTGQNWYIGCNVPRMQAFDKLSAAIGRLDAPPTTFDRGAINAAALTADAVSGISCTFSADLYDPSTDGTGVLLYQGRPRMPSRTQFGGPWRLIGGEFGDSGSPPTPGYTITVTDTDATAYGWTLVAGQVSDYYLIQLAADGRLSGRFVIAGIEVTP